MTDTPTNDKRGDIIAYGVLGLVALVIILVFAVVITGTKVDPIELTLLSLVVGAPITALGVITGFQFGSSKGSQAKDATIASTVPPAVQPATVITDPTKPGPATSLVIKPA